VPVIPGMNLLQVCSSSSAAVHLYTAVSLRKSVSLCGSLAASFDLNISSNSLTIMSYGNTIAPASQVLFRSFEIYFFALGRAVL